ncbi:MAG: aldo/keto reductase [Proteobacteria bacterium]|nr:aldo/keto reductase [Pseudomonadota bacterium]MDA1057387.1 aldo/keto reductase [Pseudomonadota bacterium]
MTVERFEIAPGYDISRLIKGGWHLAGGHGDVDRDQAIKDMAVFVERGITTFDCADHYTGVEAMIGEFRARYPSLAPLVQVHTKFVPDYEELGNVTRKYVERIIDRSIQRLKVERLDIVQYYWWDPDGKPGFVDTGLILKDLHDAGKIARIGVSNFNTRQLKMLVDAGVPIATNQPQYSPVDRRPETQLIPYCAAQGIVQLCYGTLSGGFFSADWLGKPEPFEPLGNRSLTKYKLIIEDFGGWALFQELLQAMKRAANKHDVSIALIALRWILDQPNVAAAIVGATSARHVDENLKVFSFSLDAEDKAAINAVLDRRKGPAGDCYDLERDKEGRHGSIMRYNQNALPTAPA